MRAKQKQRYQGWGRKAHPPFGTAHKCRQICAGQHMASCCIHGKAGLLLSPLQPQMLKLHLILAASEQTTRSWCTQILFFKLDFNPRGIFMGYTLKLNLGFATVLQTNFHWTKIHFPSQFCAASVSLQHTVKFYPDILLKLDDLGCNLIIFLLFGLSCRYLL